MNDVKRREYHRLDDLLPFQYRKVESEDLELLEKKYLSGTICEVGLSATPSLPQELYPNTGDVEYDTAFKEMFSYLLKYLHTIDMKLDHVTKLLSGGPEESLLFKQPERINISGSGAAFFAEEKFQADDIIELRILLPGWPFVVIPALAKVVRVLPLEDTDKSEIAVHFIAISESSRDELTKYIFRLERGLLRSKAVSKLG